MVNEPSNFNSRRSLLQQEKECRSYCLKLGWDVVRVYVDKGSGMGPRRPGRQ